MPASSGNTVRHRLGRGGDRRLNRAIHTIVMTRMRADDPPAPTPGDGTPKDARPARPDGVSSAMSLDRFSAPCTNPLTPLDKHRSLPGLMPIFLTIPNRRISRLGRALTSS
ncbi:transposase [Nocardia sp. NPDC051990]|uniref:transposase n=1 Tax=Nocardia sp. NPDC051990 TaxID=3155285 RepID=UPI003412485F